MKYNFFTKYVTHITQYNKKPNTLSKIIFWSRSKLDSQWKNIFNIERFVYVNNLPNVLLDSPEELPEIEALIVTKSEDAELLTKVIPFAIRNCENRITKITLIVPEKSVLSVIEMLRREVYFGIVKVVNEDEVIPEKIRIALRVEFQDLYGWVLAQFLKIWTVSKSSAKGVLVLDADTLLLNKRKFLNGSGKQILTPTIEYNLPYYDFLRKFDGFFGHCINSFIPHHMLMQPVFARSALSFWGNSIDNMCNDVIKNYDRSTRSPFCLCFEVYAQYMITHQPDKVALTKWSNLSVPRQKILTKDFTKMISGYEKKFNSISMHSWL